jgi:hypothetical protein
MELVAEMRRMSVFDVVQEDVPGVEKRQSLQTIPTTDLQQSRHSIYLVVGGIDWGGGD